MEIEFESEATRMLVIAWKDDPTQRVIGEADLEVLPNGKLFAKQHRPMVRGMRYWLWKPKTKVVAEG